MRHRVERLAGRSAGSHSRRGLLRRLAGVAQPTGPTRRARNSELGFASFFERAPGRRRGRGAEKLSCCCLLPHACCLFCALRVSAIKLSVAVVSSDSPAKIYLLSSRANRLTASGALG